MDAVTPKVSIGVPVFNAESFLEEALQSLLGQDFEDLEIIISDNGSTDRTEQICREAAASDARVRYLRSEVNHGLAWNHNSVLAAARGEYFKWAAYDDKHAPEFVSRCLDVLESDPAVVLVFSRTVDIDDDGVVFKKWPSLAKATADRPSERFRDAILNLRECFEIYGLMRVDALRSTPGHGAYPSADQVLLAEMALHGRFHELDEVLFFHREHPGRSMSAFASARDRVEFFQPGKAGKLTFPRFRIVYELLLATGRPQLSTQERWAARRAMLPYLRRWWKVLLRSIPGAFVHSYRYRRSQRLRESP